MVNSHHFPDPEIAIHILIVIIINIIMIPSLTTVVINIIAVTVYSVA